MQHKILIIEDDPFFASIYKHHLDKTGYITQIAADGSTALILADSFRPDLILLDLILPKIDGFTLLKILTNTSPHHQTPIIVVSNLDQAPDVDKCLVLGAKVFITKNSIDYQKLITNIKALI